MIFAQSSGPKRINGLACAEDTCEMRVHFRAHLRLRQGLNRRADPGRRVQVNGPRWRRVSLALLDVLRRSGPATVVRSCSEMPLFRPGNAPWSAMGSVPIKSVNLNSLPWSAGLAPFQDLVNVVSHPAGAL